MKRREWLGLLAAGLLRPPTLRGRRRRRRHAEWEFRLDRAQRWSLVHREGAAAVAGADIAVRLAGGEATPLGALADVRRFELTSQGDPTGWQVVGRLAGVEIAAQFVNGPTPAITVTARGLADEQALTEIRFLDTGAARVAALTSPGRSAPGRSAARLWICLLYTSDAADE